MKFEKFHIAFIILTIIFIRVAMSFTSNPSQVDPNFWWNNTWHYRVRLDINSTSYGREDWPVEYEINFTNILLEDGISDTLNESSIRIFEYDSSGSIKYEVPYQFDLAEGYNPTNNAKGTFVFLMNGTTAANAKRIYYIYFDTVENGFKPNVTYASDLAYNYTAEEFHVNTTLISFYIDTKRGDNVSGIYRIKGMKDPYMDIFITPDETENPIEYLKFSNGTQNFSFDLINNYTFTYGPVRLKIEQKGYEKIWNSSDQTNEGFMTKSYYFYDGKPWIKIEYNFTNMADYNISRNSSRASGLSFDMEKGFGPNYDPRGNSTEPFSWYWARDSGGTYHVGFVNINYTGSSIFYADNSSDGKIGITINSTIIEPNQSITDTILIHVNDTDADYNEITNLKNRYESPINITKGDLEIFRVGVEGSTNNTIYNRNETIVISLNASYDTYNKTAFVNSTIDMGTLSTSDDLVVQLYDDGFGYDENANDNIFVNTFGLNNSSQVGSWIVNFTAYDSEGLTLNTTSVDFTVTDLLNLTTTVINKDGLVDRIINSTLILKNYREDMLLGAAAINCSCTGTTIYDDNITDYDNGTYFINFKAPTFVGNFSLNCSAYFSGNEGWGTDTFSAETALTSGNITVDPSEYTSSNITLYDSENFTFSSNLTNTWYGRMKNTNITLELPLGWQSNSTLENCYNITPSDFCLKGFEITIPNETIPGEYYVYSNGTWENPNGTISTNQTYVNVTVLPNPKINITQTLIFNEVGDGLVGIIGNFTVFSWGNSNLTYVNFTTSDFSSDFVFNFTPENITSLQMSHSENISINVSVEIDTQPGIYTGLVFANSSDGVSDQMTLEITVVNTTNMSISVTPQNTNISNISLGDVKFNFTAFINNTGIAISRNANITLELPLGWQSNSTLENCYNITPLDSCSKGFEITVPNGTLPGNYYVYSSGTWENPNGTISTNQTYVNVTVLQNPLMDIAEILISNNVSDGNTQLLGNFTVKSIGNYKLTNVTFQTINLAIFNATFFPSSVSSIETGENQTIFVNISIPLSYPSSIYNGTINITAENYGSENLTMEFFILENRTWNLSSTSCQKVTVTHISTACEVAVLNLGNTIINFTISPETGNQTQVNTTSFWVNYSQSYTFNVTYDVTSNPDLMYTSLFLVDAVEADSNPSNLTLNVTLFPLTEPDVATYTQPNKTSQNESVLILVNVTDKSLTGIDYVKVNVTQPDSITYQFNMSLRSENGNFSIWELTYPNTSGTTHNRGSYFVQSEAKDKLGNLKSDNSTFSIHTKLFDSIVVNKDVYYQGDIGSIYYIIRNSTGYGLNGVNVTFEIKDLYQNITYREVKTTNYYGSVSPLPSFQLSSDSVVGNYSLTANSTYYDEIANVSAESQINTTFGVVPKIITVSGLFADLETVVVWYPNNVMKFGVLVYDGEGKPVDPEYMNLTVYDPAGNIYFTISKSSMTNENAGYYSYSHSMPVITSTGMYLARLNVSNGNFQTQKLKAFRVASGGPYDVRLNLAKLEVYQGDYLDFEVIIENKGEVSQDVTLEYWVSANNETWYSGSEAVYTPSISNQSFMRNIYIFSTQPLGNYFLNLKVTYDNVQPPIIANTSFTVISRPVVNISTTTTTIASSVGGGEIQLPTSSMEEWAEAPKKKSSISIINYRELVELAQGWNTSFTVTVKNTGETTLENLTLTLFGVLQDWYQVRPESLIELEPDNTSVFLVEFNIPKDTNLGEYDILLSVSSNTVFDKKTMKLKIYSSIDSLLRKQIDDLSFDLEKLKTEIEVSRKAGKDVSEVTLFLGEIENQIKSAEQNLANKRYDDSLRNIASAKNLIERARGLLYEKILVKERASMLFYIVPAVLLSALVIVSLLFLLYKNKKKKIMFPALEKIKGAMKFTKNQDEELLKEKEKLERMLNLIEKEKREKVIGGNVYKELKKNIEDKLNSIDKKLK